MAQLPRRLAAPAYLTALFLVVLPFLDVLSQVIPPRLHDPRWRFGAFGLINNAMLLPLLGLLIASFVAAELDHRKTERVVGLFSLVLAVATALGLALFALDTLQIRHDVAPAAALAFRMASAKAAVKGVFEVVLLAIFGISSFKGPKVDRGKAARARNSLILGATGPGTPPPVARRPTPVVAPAGTPDDGGQQPTS